MTGWRRRCSRDSVWAGGGVKVLLGIGIAQPEPKSLPRNKCAHQPLVVGVRGHPETSSTYRFVARAMGRIAGGWCASDAAFRPLGLRPVINQSDSLGCSRIQGRGVGQLVGLPARHFEATYSRSSLTLKRGAMSGEFITTGTAGAVSPPEVHFEAIQTKIPAMLTLINRPGRLSTPAEPTWHDEPLGIRVLRAGFVSESPYTLRRRNASCRLSRD